MGLWLQPKGTGVLFLGTAALQWPSTDGTNNQVLITNGTGVLSWADQSGSSSPGGNASFWTTVPGTPTRVSDTQFTIVDDGGTNNYTSLFQKGIVLQWDNAGTWYTGMVVSSSYSGSTATVNIIGNAFTTDGSLMKYGIQHAMSETFIIPGYQAVATDVAKSWYVPYPVYPIGADVYVKTAGATGTTIWDVNDQGTTMFTTKPACATTTTSDLNNVTDAPNTALAVGRVVTVDIDQITTTPPQEAYLYFWYYPASWRYRS